MRVEHSRDDSLPTKRLADCGSFLSGGTPSTAVESYWGGDIPWITSGSMYEFKISESERRLTPTGARNGSRMVPPGTVLFVVRGMSLKSEFRAGVTLRDVAFGQDCKALLPNADIDPLYVAFALRGAEDRVLRLVDEASHGTGRLDMALVSNLRLFIPGRAEQKRIAEILNTLDDAIRKAEQVIAKLRQMKRGLLYDLLTRGIDEHGEFRDPERHPEQFKDSPLGRIPTAWEVKSLGDCLLRSPQNGLYKPASAIGAGALMVGQTAFTASKSIDYSLARRAAASTSEIANWGLAEGDVLVSRVFATVEGVGQPVLVPPPPEPAVYESNMMRLKVDTAVIRSELLFLWLRDSRVRRHVVANANSSNQTSINQVGLCQIPIARPVPGEQAAILAAAAAAARREEREQAEAEKLRTLKHGLMDDLLTGRVRVALPKEAV